MKLEKLWMLLVFSSLQGCAGERAPATTPRAAEVMVVTVGGESSAAGREEVDERQPAASDCPLGMVAIPGGTFMMGSNDGPSNEQPPHSVHVPGFCMDVTEVTVDAYARCSGCSQPNTGGHCNWGESGKGNHPINCVDWEQATEYCASVGKRLPTEEEWEYAARGTTGRKYPWGNEEPTGIGCWGRDKGTCWVGSYPKLDSPFGLKDMAGNVFEWTSSGYSEDYSKNRTTDTRVIRGGGWFSFGPSLVRAAYRGWGVPSYRGGFLGFRCVG